MRSEVPVWRVAITTLGCKTNQFESAAMTEALGRDGFCVVPFDGLADIYIINTCTVTAKTDAESRRLIRRAARLNPDARIVVTGCYAQVAYGELKDMTGVNLILGNVEKKGIVGFIRGLGAEKQVFVSDIGEERLGEATRLESFAEHTRAFLQVQNGCDAFCSYCIVPYARGRSRSVPFPEVLAGIRSFADQGFQEVVLTGIHLGAYGLDLKSSLSLLDLLKEVESGQLIPRLRIGSVEPLEVTGALIDFIAGSRSICPHLHIPLQSGDDQVLSRMNRRYDTAYVNELMEVLTRKVPGICIGSDVIVGFPGETEKEFENTYHFISSLPLAYLHVFPYSPRQGTPAAAMPGHLHAGIIKERAKALRRLSELKRRAYYQRFLGEEIAVLVQGVESDGLLTGLSRQYVPVKLAGPPELVNREIRVRVIEVVREMVSSERCG